MADFKLGSTFATFSDFLTALGSFSTRTSSLYVKRCSVKMKDPSLVHLELESATYECKQGKARHGSQSSGARPNQKSFKIGCESSFRVICVRPKNGEAPHLKITKADFHHTGHDVSAHMFSLYPERRRVQVTPNVEVIVKTSLRASEVKAIIEQTQGVRLCSQDVKNLRLRLKGASADTSVVDSLLNSIKDEGGHVLFSQEEDGTLSYLAFCTREMVEMLGRFPQVLLLDFTYKTNKYLMPLLTVMAIDNYGHGFPVLHAFVKTEDSLHLQAILQFMSQLYAPIETACFVIDKDFSEINAIGAVFPNARINLCQFHISQAAMRHLKNFGHEMSTKCLQMFMHQVTTESYTEFEDIKSSPWNDKVLSAKIGQFHFFTFLYLLGPSPSSTKVTKF